MTTRLQACPSEHLVPGTTYPDVALSAGGASEALECQRDVLRRAVLRRDEETSDVPAAGPPEPTRTPALILPVAHLPPTTPTHHSRPPATRAQPLWPRPL